MSTNGQFHTFASSSSSLSFSSSSPSLATDMRNTSSTTSLSSLEPGRGIHLPQISSPPDVNHHSTESSLRDTDRPASLLSMSFAPATHLYARLGLTGILGLAALLSIAYIALVRSMRFRRLRKEMAYFGAKYPTPEALARMSNTDAHLIIKYLQQYEFPFAFECSLAASLYRPYGIPSISRVLTKTKQFANVNVASKRTADTAVLVVDFGQNPPDSEKCCSAISRMNYIHSVYQKSGLVSNNDLLYTLALLAWLPVRFIERYEWRTLTEIELIAAGVFWKSLGDAMGISYAGLPSAPPDDGVTPRSQGAWTNGLHFLEELRAWSEEYERKYMVPNESNSKAATETESVLLYTLPRRFNHIGRQCLTAVMDERLKRALLLPDPSPAISFIINFVLQYRRFLMGYLYLPRRHPHIRVTQQPDANGRYHRTTWAAQPWYVKASFGKRWRWQAWVERFLGRPIPGDTDVQPQGYVHEDVGPVRLEGKGRREYYEERDRLMRMGRGGCPFSGR